MQTRFADCSRLNVEARWDHLTSQLTWVAVWLFFKRVCPVHLVYKWSPVFHALYDWANMVVLLMFFLGIMSMVLVPWELVLFCVMGVEFKVEIMSNYSRGVKWHQGVTAGIWFFLHNVLNCPLGTQNVNAVVRGSFVRAELLGWAFQFWYCEHSVENQWGRGGGKGSRPNFVACSAWINGGWV